MHIIYRCEQRGLLMRNWRNACESQERKLTDFVKENC
jgi:hypothetical protein